MAIKRSIRFLTKFYDGAVQAKEKLATAIQVWTGEEGIVATQPDGYIDPSLIKDSEVEVFEASEAITAGDEINIWDDGGTEKARKASASGYSTRSFGYAENSAAIGQDVTVIMEGIKSGLAGLTIGDPVFLSLTAGAVTQTPPQLDGEIWQQLGNAIRADSYRLEIGEATEL